MTDISSTEHGADGLRGVKTALADFTNDFKSFQARIDARLKTQEDRITLLDRKSVARPALGSDSASAEQKALTAYLRNGDVTGLEAKSLNTASDTDGGYLVEGHAANSIQSALSGGVSLRAVARVVQVEAGAYDMLVERGELETAWAVEAAPVAESTGQKFERIRIPLHELAAMPKASQRLLEDSAFDVESWLVERIAERFGAAEAAAFISGDGVDKPRGILNHAAVAEESWDWGSLGYVATGSAGDFNPPDPANALIDLVYALGSRYRARGVFVMNSKTASIVRRFKDSAGRFLWMDSLGSSEPPHLLGHRVVTCEEMPDIAPDSFAIAFGDFGAGYTIAERPGVRVLRDPFSAKPHVQFYASSRIGGDVTDFAAIKLLKFSES